MEKNDRTCETKDPVYIYIYSIGDLDLTLPFRFHFPRFSRGGSRGSRGEEVVDGAGL